MDDIGWNTIDVRDLALSLNNRKQITEKFVERLKNKLIGKKVRIKNSGSNWKLKDDSILCL